MAILWNQFTFTHIIRRPVVSMYRLCFFCYSDRIVLAWFFFNAPYCQKQCRLFQFPRLKCPAPSFYAEMDLPALFLLSMERKLWNLRFLGSFVGLLDRLWRLINSNSF